MEGVDGMEHIEDSNTYPPQTMEEAQKGVSIMKEMKKAAEKKKAVSKKKAGSKKKKKSSPVKKRKARKTR